MLEPETTRRLERQLSALARGDRMGREGSGGAVDDPEGFAQLVALADSLAGMVSDAATRLVEEDGFSWTDLARPLGVSRQAARQKYGRPRR